MKADPAEMLAGIACALERARGVPADMPKDIRRLVAITCSLLNEDGVYSEYDLRSHLRDMAPHPARARQTYL